MLCYGLHYSASVGSYSGTFSDTGQCDIRIAESRSKNYPKAGEVKSGAVVKLPHQMADLRKLKTNQPATEYRHDMK